jgi:hypothetical protein
VPGLPEVAVIQCSKDAVPLPGRAIYIYTYKLTLNSTKLQVPGLPEVAVIQCAKDAVPLHGRGVLR